MTPRSLLLRMTRRSGGWVVLLALTAVTGAVAETALPAVVGRTVDAALYRTATGPGARAVLGGLAGPGGWLTVLAALLVVIVGCEAFGQLATGTTAASATSWLRRSLLRHVLFTGPKLTRRYPAGDLVSRIIGGAADAGGAPAGLALAAAALIPPAGAVAALVLIDPWLAVTLGTGFPLLALMLRGFVRDTSEVVTRYQQAQGAIAARLLEALAGARTIAAAGTCDQEIVRVLSPLRELRARGDQTWRIQGRVAAQGALLLPILQVLVLAVGGLALAARRISPGELLAASQYAVLGAGGGAAIAHLGRLARARAGAGRAAELLAEREPRYGTRSLPAGRGLVEFRSVVVRAGGETVLDQLDLAVPAGTLVAIVGRSGAGKSMLAALAGRLADPDEGEVRLDGVKLTALTRAALRDAVQYAFERPSLLGATVADAIGFGGATVPRRGIVSAARAASADAFVRRLPAGYETALTRAPMSGGEVQRLGLARAFAHADGARLLILDDATSSLDTITEMQVSGALTGEFGARTRMIVAHRASTAARADLVAWLDQGRLRGCAPHRELWADPGYRAIFDPGAGAAAAAR
ncbi:MAG TPA: ABC transporter ATP-binding protein [Streptosporangiaceae bacterium]|nr:ABC transporter ATP-binding protein [Streptosporangiaceae bacterium]